MSRFLSEHPSPWGWNPLQYFGLPAQFLYVPGLHYLVAALIWLTGLPAEYAYKLVTATLAALGPVTVFLLARYFTRSSGWALGTALAYTLFSPSYGLIQELDGDRGFAHLPWRLHVYYKYGEGPHNAGLTLLPLAVIAAWAAGTARSHRAIVPAAVAMAAVTLVNWVAALALAFLMLSLLLAAAGAPDAKHFRLRRVLAAAGLAYLLACFWLTPTFIRTIAFNWPADAFNYHLRNAQMLLLAGIAAGVLLLRLVLYFARAPFYLTFVTLGAFIFAWLVLFYYVGGLDTFPESRRYAPEFELFIFLAMFEWFRITMQTGNRALQFAAAGTCALILYTGAGQLRKYVMQSRAALYPIPKEQTAEYRLARWLAEQEPQGRVLASGGLRFRLNSWFDLQQVGGGFESGLRNRTPLHFAYQIRTGLGSSPESEGRDALLQLKAAGVEYVVVHGPESREYYRDYKNPGKFEGLLERVRAEAGDVVYSVPFNGLSHLVKHDEWAEGVMPDMLAGYVEGLEDGARPELETKRLGFGALEVHGPAPDGMAISVKVSYADGWRATQDGQPVAVRAGPLGFMRIDPKPSAHTVLRLRYEGTAEQKALSGLSALSWAGAAGLLLLKNHRQGAKIL